MKKLLNTVYITSENAALKKEGENLIVLIEDEEKKNIPLHMLASIVVFGATYISPSLIGACARKGITLVLLSRYGRFEARIEGPTQGNVLLRKSQYNWSDSDKAIEITRSILMGKISNQRTLLVRAHREHADSMTSSALDELNLAITRLGNILTTKITHETNIDSLRGHEGDAGRIYFGVFNHLLRSSDEEIQFSGRTRRPPKDPVNALLSFLYTLLVHDCRSGLETVGLDPAVGFLHTERPGRPSLALDLMEELRPHFVDRLVLSLFNRRQLRGRDFTKNDDGGYLLTDEVRKTVLEAWQEKKREERAHPFLQERVANGLVPYLQALLLARHIRGDLDGYPPWFVK